MIRRYRAIEKRSYNYNLTLSSKAASSFECDGCNHHASFHSLENPAEDAVRQKWLEQEAAQAREQQAVVGANNKKRKMNPQTLLLKDDERIVVLDDLGESVGGSNVRTRGKNFKGSASGPGSG